MNKKTQNGFAPIILLIIVLVAAAGIGGAVYYSKKGDALSSPQPLSDESSVQTEKARNISKWQRYESDLGFSFEYPSDWKVEFDNSQFTSPVMGLAVYDPKMAGSGIIEGEDAGVWLEAWANKAGFSITISSKESFRDELVSRLTKNFKSFLEYPNIVGKVEEITVSGYPAVRYTVTKPESSSALQAAWRDDTYVYWINTSSYKDKAGLLREHEVILDHILDTFRSDSNN